MFFKKLSAIAITSGIICISATCCITAKSLKDSFSSGTSTTCVDTSFFKGNEWKKTVWAKTKGYNKYHYVRAYIGGTNNSAAHAWIDSKKHWSYHDVSAKVSCKQWDFNRGRLGLFPKAYGKYGTRKRR